MARTTWATRPSQAPRSKLGPMSNTHRGGSAPARTRAEKKELARRRREERRRREQRARFIRTFLTLAVISFTVWLIVVLATRG